jgi:hypothetical protein
VKALVCLRCSSICSPRLDGTWTYCECADSAIRWVDPHIGTAETWANDPYYSRILGLNNEVLVLPLAPPVHDAFWRQLHDVSCENAGEDYFFHARRRNCWAVLTLPGESDDVTVRGERPPPDPA